MAQHPAVLICLAALAGCGAQSPVGNPAINHIDYPDMAVQYRLRVDKTGTITDALMQGQECAWMLDEQCEKRCFPVERMWAACTSGGGAETFYYTHYGLTTRFAWGRITKLTDPACGGQDTNRLVGLDFVDVEKRPRAPFVCGIPNESLTPAIGDRNWYFPHAAEIDPATVQDLPR